MGNLKTRRYIFSRYWYTWKGGDWTFPIIIFVEVGWSLELSGAAGSLQIYNTLHFFISHLLTIIEKWRLNHWLLHPFWIKLRYQATRVHLDFLKKEVLSKEFIIHCRMKVNIERHYSGPFVGVVDNYFTCCGAFGAKEWDVRFGATGVLAIGLGSTFLLWCGHWYDPLGRFVSWKSKVGMVLGMSWSQIPGVPWGLQRYFLRLQPFIVFASFCCFTMFYCGLQWNSIEKHFVGILQANFLWACPLPKQYVAVSPVEEQLPMTLLV